MSAAGDSAKVIFVAFLANLGIALAKFGGAFFSGSSSLLAEAIHSLVDSTNQVLLLIGNKRAQKPPDQKHPLGYGREAFFWSFLVAILLFSMGGCVAIYEGLHKMKDPEPLSYPLLGLGILIVSLGLEGYSFWACFKEVKKQPYSGNLWAWFKNTKNSELLVVFTEDAAAMVGLIVATICLSMAWITHNPMWDCMGSIVVGVILLFVSVLLSIEIKSFIVGESSSDDVKVFFEESVPKLFPGGRVLNFIATQTGSNQVMLGCKIHPGRVTDVKTAIDLVNQLEVDSKKQFPVVKWQFIELDHS